MSTDTVKVGHAAKLIELSPIDGMDYLPHGFHHFTSFLVTSLYNAV